MNRKPFLRAISLAAVISALIMPAIPAAAQFGTAMFPRGGAEAPGAPAGLGQQLSVVVYPVAAFQVDFPGGSATKYGVLASVEKAFPSSTGRSASALGGWLWSSGDAGIYELHAKHYFTPQIGVQAGVIGGTKVSGYVGDAFVLYNLDGRRLTGNSSAGWSMQFAAGSHFGRSAGFTGFWQGSVDLSPKWSVNVSYWYIRETPFDFHRIAAGVGYHF